MASHIDHYDIEKLTNSLCNLGYVLEYQESVGSTMDDSLKKTKKLPRVVLADHQTKGRGRHENIWKDEKYSAVLMSIAENEKCVNDLPLTLLSHLVALQVCCVLNNMTKSQNFKIKWPNDVLLSGKKVAGILLEQKNGITVVGIGIDVYGNDEVEGAFVLKKNLTFGRQRVVVEIINAWANLKKELNNRTHATDWKKYDELWKKNSFILHKKVFLSLKSGAVIGVVKQSCLGGNIIVKTDKALLSISENEYIPGSFVMR